MSRKIDHVPFDDDMKAAIDAHKKRTGWSAVELMRIVRKIAPKTSPSHIQPVIAINAPERVDRRAYDAVISAFESTLPEGYDHEAAIKTSGRRVPFSSDMREELANELSRTGVAYDSISRAAQSSGLRLTSTKICNIVAGRYKTVLTQEWDCMMKHLKLSPSHKHPKPAGVQVPDGYVEIQEGHIATIRFHRKRTGVGFPEILDGNPFALKPHIISSWLSGATLTANKAAIEWVIAQYACKTDKQGWK